MFITDHTTLKILLNGMSHFVDIGAGEPAVMFYETSGHAHIRLPDGAVMHGTWTQTEKGYDVVWKNGPSGSWQLGYQPGIISYLDGAGKNHGPITSIIPGDAADLAE